MRIITWNCNGGFRNKFSLLENLNFDIAIIQECENPEQSKNLDYKNWAKNYFWIGENKNKGIGVFADSKIKLDFLEWENDNLKYFLPLKFNNQYTLLATWCHGANSPTFGYIGQLWKYLQIHKYKLNTAIIAGDFNSNKIWDKWDRWWNHSDVVNELSELNIKSFYHHFYNENQGEESRPTFFLQRNVQKPYHIDYFFGSEEILKKLNHFEILNQNEWLKYSDHLPIIIDI